MIMEVDFKTRKEEIPVRRNIFLIATLLCMSAAVPSFAGMTGAAKDECILASRNCSNAVDDIQTQMKRISKEIDKGTAVYTPQELKKLEMKLTEVKELLNDMEKH
jgi:t-SNARE complex subunit (syntaxin)